MDLDGLAVRLELQYPQPSIATVATHCPINTLHIEHHLVNFFSGRIQVYPPAIACLHVFAGLCHMTTDNHPYVRSVLDQIVPDKLPAVILLVIKEQFMTYPAGIPAPRYE